MGRKSEHLQLVKQPKALPRWKKTLRFLFRLTLLVALFALLKYGETFFRVDQITVEDTVNLDKQAILEAGNLNQGMSILFFKESTVAEAIMQQYPEIREVSISRQLPDRLNVELTERTLAAYLVSPDGYWLIDSDTVFFASTVTPAGDYPVILGLEDTAIVAGQPIDCRSRRETLRSFFQSWELYEQLRIEELEFSDRYNLVARLAGDVEIWLGDDQNMENKLLLVRETLPHLDGEIQARLDVRSGKRLVVSGSALIEEKEVNW